MDDRAGSGDRAIRVALGEPQYRGGDTHLTAFAVLVVEFGQHLFDLLGFAEAYQGLQEQSPGRRDEVMRHDEAAGQCLGGAESGSRLGGPVAGQVEQPAYVVDPQGRGGLGAGAEGTLGLLDPVRFSQRLSGESLVLE